MTRFAAPLLTLACSTLALAEGADSGDAGARAEAAGSFLAELPGRVMAGEPVAIMTVLGVAVVLAVLLKLVISSRKRAVANALRAQTKAEDDVELSLDHDRELRNRIVRELASGRQRVREAEIAAGDGLTQETRERVRAVCDRIENYASTVESAEHGNARRFKEGKLPDSALSKLVDLTRTLDTLNHDVGVEATGLAGALASKDDGKIGDHCKQLEKVMSKLSDKFSERMDYLRGI